MIVSNVRARGRVRAQEAQRFRDRLMGQFPELRASEIDAIVNDTYGPDPLIEGSSLVPPGPRPPVRHYRA